MTLPASDLDLPSDEPCLKRVPPSPEPTPDARAVRHESPPASSSLIGTSSHAWCFVIAGPPLYAQKGGLLDRGTLVVPLTYPHSQDPVQPGCSSIDERLVANMSWQPSNHLPEDITLRLIRRKIPTHWSKHVTDLKCSMSLRSDELGLPRKKIVALVEEVRRDGTCSEGEAKFREALRVDRTQDRILRVLVCSLYLPLNQVKDAEEFKTVFKDVVKVHYIIYKKTGILHRDLSINNIMFIRCSGCVIVLLNDWDLAAPEAIPSSRTSGQRIGTAAYMAMDLLDYPDGYVQHQYCYDLESFAWILMWCAFLFCFDGGEVRLDALPERILTWTGGNYWEDIRDTKTMFLCKKIGKNLEHITTSMKSLKKCWIAPVLRSMMMNTFHRGMRETPGPIEGDFFEFATFMKVLESGVEFPDRAVWDDEDSTFT